MLTLGAIIIGLAALIFAAIKALTPKIVEDEIRALLTWLARWLLKTAVARLPADQRLRHEQRWTDEVEAHIGNGLLVRAVLRAAYIQWLTRGPRATPAGATMRITRVQRLRRAVANNEESASMLTRLWSPTAASACMLTLEFPLLLLVAAHTPSTDMAVGGLAWALGTIVLVDAGALALTTVSAMAKQRGWSRRDMLAYTALVGVAGCGLLATISTSLLGDPIESLLGLPHDRWDSAQLALRGLAIAPLLVAFRRYARGQLTDADQTTWILPATLARTTVAAGLAVGLTQVADLSTFGIGLALTLGVALEAAALNMRHRAVAAAGWSASAGHNLRRIAHVHIPLAGTMLLKLVPPIAVLFALGASGGSLEAVAAWSTICGLVWIVSSMTLDIEAITAAHYRVRAAATLQFTAVLGVSLTVLWVALGANTGGRLDLLERAGLSNAAATHTLTALLWLAPFPCLCVMREWLRGTLVAQDRSWGTVTAIAVGSATLVAGLLIGLVLGMPTLVAAAMSVSLGALAEAAVLTALSRRAVAPAGPPAPPSGGTPATPVEPV